MTGTTPPKFSRVRVYTFGAPRVGNSDYARDFDAIGMETFRVVNGADIVPRLPRHANAAGAVLDYEHVGRTVLISPSEAYDGGFWVEGESDDADCPLRDVSPLTNPFGPNSLLADVGSRARGAASAAWGAIEKSDADAVNQGLSAGERREALRRSFERAVDDLGRAKDEIASRIGSMSAVDAIGMVGLDGRFVQSELQMIEALTSGKSIVEHLEPSYYDAMERAIEAREQTRSNDGPIDQRQDAEPSCDDDQGTESKLGDDRRCV